MSLRWGAWQGAKSTGDLSVDEGCADGRSPLSIGAPLGRMGGWVCSPGTLRDS